MSTKEKINIKSGIVIQGIFNESFFDNLKEKPGETIYFLEGRPSFTAALINGENLTERGLSATLIADNMAGFLFYKGAVKEVCIAYQSLSEEGAVCFPGALILGVLAQRHNVPVNLYPAQSVESDESDDVCSIAGVRVAPVGIKSLKLTDEFLPKKYITKVN